MKRLLITLFVFTGILACGPETEEAPIVDENIPVIEMASSSYKTGPCDGENQPCFEISFILPELKGGSAENILHFNATVDSLAVLSLRDFTVDAPESAGKEELIDLLFTEYNTFSEGVDDSSGFMTWAIEIKADIVYQSKDLLSFSFENYSFTGGAHPNTFVMYYNYSFAENKLLRLEDIVTDTLALTKVAESIFRTQNQIAEGQDLSEKGFWFDEGFKLNQNFVWTGNHIIFRYNPYEIGPYAMGAHEVKIPVEAVKHILITKEE